MVAGQLTRFIGGDSVERLQTVRRIARGGYRSSMGSACEFSDSIRGLQEDYETVIDDGLVDKIRAIRAQGLPEAMLLIPTVLPDEKVVEFWDPACANQP